MTKKLADMTVREIDAERIESRNRRMDLASKALKEGLTEKEKKFIDRACVRETSLYRELHRRRVI